MDKPIETQVSAYLKSQSRNKIVFYRDSYFNFTPIDLGNLLSQVIYNLNDLNRLPMKISSELDLILNKAIFNHTNYGKMLAIANIGILLEIELKQDLTRLFEKYSNNNVLFVKWSGEIDSEFLYFLTKENGIKINIKNLSHIVI